MMANSNFVLTVSFALLVGAASAVKQINNIKKYPACLVDNDCTEMHKLRDHACFQYFCYPWKSMPDVASAPPRPLQECRRASDCPSVTHPSGNKKQPFVRRILSRIPFFPSKLPPPTISSKISPKGQVDATKMHTAFDRVFWRNILLPTVGRIAGVIPTSLLTQSIISVLTPCLNT